MIYLDHMATTPLDPSVIEAMAPWLSGARFGNPHATANAAGRAAEQVVEGAVASIAAMIKAMPGEIILTSGATESDNMALVGATRPGDHLITVETEHSAVIAVARRLETQGRTVTIVGTDGAGRVDPAAIAAACRPETRLVSVMAINNETGTRQPIGEIGTHCRANDILFHSDATQALTTTAIDVRTQPIDLLSISSHKLYGPQGIGALFVRDGVEVEPLIIGGGQQNDRRSGTVPVALAAGFGAACRAAISGRDADHVRIAALRDRLWERLSGIPEARRTVPAEICAAHCLHVTVGGVDMTDILFDLPALAASTGSACASGGKSPVLQAMGMTPRQSFGAIRFGLGRFTTSEEVDAAAHMLSEAIARVRTRRSAAE